MAPEYMTVAIEETAEGLDRTPSIGFSISPAT